MPKEDAWDWPFLLYVGTVILKRSEAEFWRMTPRKLSALSDVHVEVNNPDERNSSKPRNNQISYIDQVM